MHNVFSLSLSKPHSPADFFVLREEHIGHKIDTMIVEAKGKMAKGDKKGKSAF
jgi:hypothetical protein